jgi:hypothetical protein
MQNQQQQFDPSMLAKLLREKDSDAWWKNPLGQAFSSILQQQAQQGFNGGYTSQIDPSSY